MLSSLALVWWHGCGQAHSVGIALLEVGCKWVLTTRTDDELMSDASPFKEVDDVAYDVEAKFVIRGTGVDIPTNDEDGGGLDDGEERVINIVDAHNLIVRALLACSATMARRSEARQ